MLTASLAPLDETITIAELTCDPYPTTDASDAKAPVLRVKSVGRTFLTKAADTKYVKDNAVLFSSDDPNTLMTQALLIAPTQTAPKPASGLLPVCLQREQL